MKNLASGGICRHVRVSGFSTTMPREFLLTGDFVRRYHCQEKIDCSLVNDVTNQYIKES